MFKIVFFKHNSCRLYIIIITGIGTRRKIIVDIRAIRNDTLCQFANLNDIPYLVTSSKHHGSCKVINLHTTPYDQLQIAFQVFEYAEELSKDVLIFTEPDLGKIKSEQFL